MKLKRGLVVCGWSIFSGKTNLPDLSSDLCLKGDMTLSRQDVLLWWDNRVALTHWATRRLFLLSFATTRRIVLI